MLGLEVGLRLRDCGRPGFPVLPGLLLGVMNHTILLLTAIGRETLQCVQTAVKSGYQFRAYATQALCYYWSPCKTDHSA